MFARKGKDRRFERVQASDAKLRTRDRSRVFWRLAGSAFAALAALAAGVLLFWKGGGLLVDRLVLRNDAFSVQVLDIQTDGIIPIAHISRWTGLGQGDNLVGLDLGRVKRDLELVPSIESAAVEKVLPGTLRIRVTEREPIAQVCLFQSKGPDAPLEPKVLHLDRNGYVIPDLNLLGLGATLSNYFPTIVGIQASDLLAGRQVTSEQTRAGLRFLAEFARSPVAAAVSVTSVDVSGSQTLRVTTDDGSEITLANENFDQQLARWQRIYNYGVKTEKTLATLDLAVANYVPARWLEVSQTSLTKPRVRKPSLYRKKHV